MIRLMHRHVTTLLTMNVMTYTDCVKQNGSRKMKKMEVNNYNHFTSVTHETCLGISQPQKQNVLLVSSTRPQPAPQTLFWQLITVTWCWVGSLCVCYSTVHTSPPAWTNGSGHRRGHFLSGCLRHPPGSWRPFLRPGHTSLSSGPASAFKWKETAFKMNERERVRSTSNGYRKDMLLIVRQVSFLYGLCYICELIWEQAPLRKHTY